MNTEYTIFQEDCNNWLKTYPKDKFHLSFIDPPFNQGKDYKYFNDNQLDKQYWSWIKEVLSGTYNSTVQNGAIYFMQREKNIEYVLKALRETGWTFQNIIIWKKKNFCCSM